MKTLHTGQRGRTKNAILNDANDTTVVVAQLFSLIEHIACLIVLILHVFGLA